MVLNNWMSEFYDQKWWEINIKDISNIKEKGLYELRISSDNYLDVLEAQKNNFTLVESLVKFKGEIIPHNELPDEVKLGEKEHLNEILEILNVSVLNNDLFYNRFKNKSYFTKEKCEQYYKSSVINFLGKSNSLTMIAEDELGVYGFRIMKEVAPLEYSGVMTAALPRARGKKVLSKLQKGMSFIINEPYFENNATNLGNYTVIKNHIREERRFQEVEHIFYKKQ